LINIGLNIILRFIFLVLLQVLILNNIQLGGYINPYLYLLFVLMLPFETPKIALLFIGFFLGLLIDMFSNTMGMHAAATVFATFIRVYILNFISPRGGYEFGSRPSIQDMGLIWFLTYAGILIFFHHLLLFYIEVFRLNEFFTVLYRVILSSTFTLALVVISQFLIYGKKK